MKAYAGRMTSHLMKEGRKDVKEGRKEVCEGREEGFMSWKEGRTCPCSRARLKAGREGKMEGREG
jgi:hypothetical protein